MKSPYISPALRVLSLVGGAQILEQSFQVDIDLAEGDVEFDVKIERGHGNNLWDETW